MSALTTGCSRIWSHSCWLRRPGLRSTRSEMLILPMSWRYAASSSGARTSSCQPSCLAQHHRVGRDACGVAQRVVVLGVERGAQRLEVAEVHPLDLVVELRVLDGEGELRAHALEQVAVDGGERVGIGAAQVEDAEEAGVGRQRDDDAGGETLDSRRSRERRQVLGQAHDDHALRRDALDEPGLEVVELQADQRLGGRARADDVAHPATRRAGAGRTPRTPSAGRARRRPP